MNDSCLVTTCFLTGMQIRTFVVAVLLNKNKNCSDSIRLRKHA
jgi:hypothetical protein